MANLIGIILIFLLILISLYRRYKPQIEVVVLVKRYRIYLWYDKYEGREYIGKAYKFLFEI